MANHKLISKVAAGAIAGVTTRAERILEEPGPERTRWHFRRRRWAAPATAWRSAGRCSARRRICRSGVDPIDPGKLYHACQSLDFAALGNDQCAAPEVFHTCIGSNKCKAQGGCGFVQQTTGGGICSHAAGTRGPPERRLACMRAAGRRALLGAERQQVRHVRRLRGADLGLAGLSQERHDAAVRLHRQRQHAGAARQDGICGRRSGARRGVSRLSEGHAAPQAKTPPPNPPPPDHIRLAFPPST